MKIGVQTANILDPLGIEAGFQLIGEAGFDCVDFNIDHALSYESIVKGARSEFFDRSEAEMLAAMRPYKEAAAANGIGFAQMPWMEVLPKC